MAKQKIRGASRANTQKVMQIFADHMTKLPIADIETKNGRVTYHPALGEISFKITMRIPMEDGNVAEPKEIHDFNLHKPLHPELKDVSIGDVFKNKRTCFEITGFRPRAYKRPLMARNLNTGKTFVFELRVLNNVEWQ